MYQSIRTGKSEKYPKIRKATKDQKGIEYQKGDQRSERLPKIGKVTGVQKGYQRSERYQRSEK